MKAFSLLLCLSVWYTTQAKVSYHGFRMYEIVPRNGLQLQILQRMYPESRRDGIDFWVPPRGINIPVQISVPPKSNIVATFRLMGMGTRLVMENVQHHIDQQMKKDLKFIPKGKVAAFNFEEYQNLEAIENWIDNITTVHSDKATVMDVGNSPEGRTLKLIKIDTGKSNNGFFFNGGIHAREWISPATVMYMTAQMLDKYGTDATITEMVDSFVWYILPVFNVDGYYFTWTEDRMWRKTRSINQGSTCIGVDPNRNWDYHWSEDGASTNPCSETYCGPSAFSEVEIKAVADFIDANKGTIKAYIDFHSYSQYWMTPWGWTSALPDDYQNLDNGAMAAVDALEANYGTVYQHGNIARIIYVASGSSADWAYGQAGIKYSYAVELRDTGEYGFLLPPDQIIPSGIETLEAMKALSKYITNNP